MKIQFKDVGRNKENWSEDIDTGQHYEDIELDILIEINRNGGLMSRGISVIFDEFSLNKGTIYAGLFKVGTFAPL